MGQQIEQDLESRGVAQVVVVLKPHARPPAGAAVAGLSGTVSAANAGPELSQIGACFVEDEHSQTSQLLRAAQSGRSVRSSHRVKRSKPAAVELETPPIARYYPNLGVMLGNVGSSGLKTLRAHADVDAVLGAPMWGLIRPVAATSVGKPKNGTAWGLSAMKIPALWKKGLTGKGVVIGHLDTGLDAKHSALKKALAAFAEFDDLGRQVPKAKPFDGDPGSPTRPRGHGTHTAATLAGRPVGKMKVGVAPGAMLASAIVIEGGDTVARMLGGMDWAVSQGVRILSMSVGLPGWFDEFRTIMKLLRARGVLPIFASGNEGPGTSRSPGNYIECLSVGAFDRHHVMASFSSSQRFNRAVDPIVPDLAGPGVEIWSAKPGGGYQGMSGTSMATPHVAGLAALLMEAEPTKTIDEIEKAIRKSCSPNSLPAERAGNGAPNGVKALSLL